MSNKLTNIKKPVRIPENLYYDKDDSELDPFIFIPEDEDDEESEIETEEYNFDDKEDTVPETDDIETPAPKEVKKSGKLINNSFNSTELTKITINPFEHFSDHDDELHHIRIQAHQFLKDEDYDKYVTKKYTHKRQLNSLVVNKIFEDLSLKFQRSLSLTEVFSVLCDFFEIDPTEIYGLLSIPFQELLKMELVNSTKFTKRELFNENTNDGYYMPEI